MSTIHARPPIKERSRFGIPPLELETAKKTFDQRREAWKGPPIKIYAWSADQWLSALQSSRSFANIGRELGVCRSRVQQVHQLYFPFARDKETRKAFWQVGQVEFRKAAARRRSKNEQRIFAAPQLRTIVLCLESMGLTPELVRKPKPPYEVKSRQLMVNSHLCEVLLRRPYIKEWGAPYILVSPFCNGYPQPLPEFLLIFAETSEGPVRRLYTIPTKVLFKSGLKHIGIKLVETKPRGTKPKVDWSRFADEKGLALLKITKLPR